MQSLPANVIIMGAGSSVDAGVPTLKDFIDRMWEYSIRGKVGERGLSNSERELLRQANDIRLKFERYHSRAYFDTRNVEDLLSLLSFESIGQGASCPAKADYDLFVKAIALTIELSCKVQPSNIPVPSGGDQYVKFWRALIPKFAFTIVTFNYDLVLERSLWNACHYPRGNASHEWPQHITLNYGIEPDFSIELQPYNYSRDGHSQPALRPEFSKKTDHSWITNLYKLHGSLNWSSNAGSGEPGHSLLLKTVESPLILPPVFNKMDSLSVGPVWANALSAIRSAKNLIIVGYSLPRTDIYMQYFLKAAVGPNSDLNRMFVFDPILFKEDERAKDMRLRYSECFSPQFRDRISFEPPAVRSIGAEQFGSFGHLVSMLESDPKSLLF